MQFLESSLFVVYLSMDLELHVFYFMIGHLNHLIKAIFSMRETQESAYHHFRSINISIAIQHIGASHSTLDILNSSSVNITTGTVFLLHLVFKPAYNH